MAVPPDTPKTELQADLRSLKGQMVLVDSTAGGYGAGPQQAPRRDLEASRVGADPPDSLAVLRNDAAYAVLAADPAPNLPSLISRIFSGYGPNWGGLQTRWV